MSSFPRYLHCIPTLWQQSYHSSLPSSFSYQIFFVDVTISGSLLFGWCPVLHGNAENAPSLYKEALRNLRNSCRRPKRRTVIPEFQRVYLSHIRGGAPFKGRCVLVAYPNAAVVGLPPDISRVKNANGGTTFTLTVIDEFSKRAWCVSTHIQVRGGLTFSWRQSDAYNRDESSVQERLHWCTKYFFAIFLSASLRPTIASIGRPPQ